MRIAIQLFGHMRTYQNCYHTLFKKIIEHHDCDIFIHTWDKLDYSPKKRTNLNLDCVAVDSENIKVAYHPKKLVIETQELQDFGPNTDSVTGMNAMLYSMHSVNALRKEYQKEQNITYDLILCTRPDILFHSPLKLEEFISLLSADEIKNTLFRACCVKKIFNDFRWLPVTDVLFFSVPEVMDKAVSVRESTTQAMLQCDTPKLKNPETYWVYEVAKMGVNQLAINYQYKKDFEIVRGGKFAVKDLKSLKYLRRKIIKINGSRSKSSLYLKLFPRLRYKIFAFSLQLFGYQIVFSIGYSPSSKN